MSIRITNVNLDELADMIVYDLEGDVLDRAGLGNEWENLDRGTLDEIRAYWRDIIINRLKTLPEMISDEPDSDFYALKGD